MERDLLDDDARVDPQPLLRQVPRRRHRQRRSRASAAGSRCAVPAVLGDAEVWALPCVPVRRRQASASTSCPSRGPAVWVEFEGGDPSLPDLDRVASGPTARCPTTASPRARCCARCKATLRIDDDERRGHRSPTPAVPDRARATTPRSTTRRDPDTVGSSGVVAEHAGAKLEVANAAVSANSGALEVRVMAGPAHHDRGDAAVPARRHACSASRAARRARAGAALLRAADTFTSPAARSRRPAARRAPASRCSGSSPTRASRPAARDAVRGQRRPVPERRQRAAGHRCTVASSRGRHGVSTRQRMERASIPPPSPARGSTPAWASSRARPDYARTSSR